MIRIYIILLCGFISTGMVSAGKDICWTVNASFKICKRSEDLVSVSEIFSKEITQNWPQSLYIEDQELSSITPGAFKGLTIIQLIIVFKDTKLHLEKESFSGLSMLQSLQILSGTVVLQADLFIKINIIKFLTLRIDGVEEKPVGDFPELTSLRAIRFFESNFGILDTFTFSRFSFKISNLMLGSNNIATVKSGSFFNVYQLKSLQFYENGIQDIEPEAFVGLHYLEVLEIFTENITRIQKNVFCRLESLKKLTIVFSNVEKIDEGAFKGLTLESLDLTNNSLLAINAGTFSGLQTKFLDLSKNPITIIGGDAFKSSIVQNFFGKNLNMTGYDIHRWGLRTSTKIVITK